MPDQEMKKTDECRRIEHKQWLALCASPPAQLPIHDAEQVHVQSCTYCQVTTQAYVQTRKTLLELTLDPSWTPENVLAFRLAASISRLASLVQLNAPESIVVNEFFILQRRILLAQERDTARILSLIPHLMFKVAWERSADENMRVGCCQVIERLRLNIHSGASTTEIDLQRPDEDETIF